MKLIIESNVGAVGDKRFRTGWYLTSHWLFWWSRNQLPLPEPVGLGFRDEFGIAHRISEGYKSVWKLWSVKRV